LWRQQREDRAARRRQCRYVAGDGRLRIGIDRNARWIAWSHIGEIGLPDIGLDVEIVGQYQRKRRLAGVEKKSADSNAFDLVGNAVEGREDGGKTQITRRAIDSRLRLSHCGLLIDWQVRVAAELGQRRSGLAF
jgi:hypothetical protein